MLYNQLAQGRLGIMLSIEGVFFHNRKLQHPIFPVDSVKSTQMCKTVHSELRILLQVKMTTVNYGIIATCCVNLWIQ